MTSREAPSLAHVDAAWAVVARALNGRWTFNGAPRGPELMAFHHAIDAGRMVKITGREGIGRYVLFAKLAEIQP